MSDLPPFKNAQSWFFICPGAFIMLRDGAHAVFACGSHYFWWQTSPTTKSDICFKLDARFKLKRAKQVWIFLKFLFITIKINRW